MFHLIDQLADLGTVRISLFGGEPLLREDIGDIIRYVRQKGMHCSMISNGYLVPHKIEDLKHLNMLVLSLDGTKEAHDANREKDSFEKVMRALNVAKENKIPLEINLPLTNKNLDSIDFLMETGEKFGYLASFLILQHTADVTGNPVGFTPSQEECRTAIRKLIDRRKSGAPVMFSTKTYETVLQWPDYSVDKIMGQKPDWTTPKCWAGRYYCNIDTNGDVYPCVITIKEMESLNWRKVGFKKAWDYIANHNCEACFSPCYTEFNHLFSFNIRVLLNTLRRFAREK